MKKILFVSMFVLACTAKKSSDDTATGKTLTVKATSGAVSVNSIDHSDDPLPVALYDVQAEAFYYRPNESFQTFPIETCPDSNICAPSPYPTQLPDWSVWKIGGLNGIMPSGGTINSTAAIDGVDPVFKEGVGVFQMDMVHVHGLMYLINASNDACGIGAANVASWLLPITNNPVNIGNCANRWIKLSYDNSYLNQLDVLFVRKDWFPTPVQVYPIRSFRTMPGGGATLYPYYKCFNTDTPLNAFQEEILNSFLSHWYSPDTQYDAACTLDPVDAAIMDVNDRTTLNVVPEFSDLPVVQFIDGREPLPYNVTRHGEPVPQAANSLIGGNILMTVGVFVRPSLFVDFASFNDSSATNDITIDRTSSNTPWGLQLDFEDVPLPPPAD